MPYPFRVPPAMTTTTLEKPQRQRGLMGAAAAPALVFSTPFAFGDQQPKPLRLPRRVALGKMMSGRGDFYFILFIHL